MEIIIKIKWMCYETPRVLSGCPTYVYSGLSVLLPTLSDQTSDTLFPFTGNRWYSFDFKFDSVCFMVPFAFHLCCLPLVLLCISNWSWFTSLQGCQWSRLGLTLVHLPQFSAARSPESLSKPCFKFTNVSADWPVPVSVTDVWGTLAPGLALHDKIPLFWGQYDTMSKKMSDNKSWCVLSCWAKLIFLKTVSYNITKFPLSRVKQTTERIRPSLSTKGFVFEKVIFFSV